MLHARVIPVLLLRNSGLVKTVEFNNPRYIGDPINAVKIFNEKEVDELTFLDISASILDRGPNFQLLKDISSEAFMPFSYGGGIRNIEDIKRLYGLGVEKIILNSSIVKDHNIVSNAAAIAGSSGVVVSIDVKCNWFGKSSVYTLGGKLKINQDPVEYAIEMECLGAGEILLNSINRDGMMTGYDLNLISEISSSVSIPVVACGGAGTLQDFREAVNSGASAVAAGSMFVYHGKHQAVLLTYPEYKILDMLFK
jgi:cyclase